MKFAHAEAPDDRPSQSSEERMLRRMLDHVPALVAYWTPDLHNVFANNLYADYFGIDPTAIAGSHVTEVIGEELFIANTPYLKGVLRGEPQSFFPTMKDLQGHTKHLETSYIPDIEDGEVIGFFAFVVDVTFRHQAEQSLLQHIDMHRALARNMPDSLVMLFDHELRFHVADGPLLSRIGHTRRSIEGKTLPDIQPTNLRKLQSKCRSVLEGQKIAWDLPLDGHIISVNMGPVRDNQEEIVGGIVIGTDVTEVRRREMLSEALRVISAATAQGASTQHVADLASTAMTSLFQCQYASVTQFTDDKIEVVSLSPPDATLGVASPIDGAADDSAVGGVAATSRAQFRYYDSSSKGRARQSFEAGIQIAVAAPILVKGKTWGAIGVGMATAQVDEDAIVREMSEFATALSVAISSSEAWHSLAQLATVDPLTGLGNRRLFDQELARAVGYARDNNDSVGLVLVDLNDFKAINDTHGHQRGDAVLQAIGELMLRIRKPDEVLIRLGGDEFALILPGGTTTATESCCRRLMASIDGRDFVDLTVHLSCGAASLQGDNINSDLLIRLADNELYRVKRERHSTPVTQLQPID